MPDTQPRVAVPGSERTPLPQAQPLHAAHPDERLEVTVRLRPKAPLPTPPDSSALADALPAQRTYLSREELDQHYGADPHDIGQVAEFARAHGLAVVHSSAAERSVQLAEHHRRV